MEVKINIQREVLEDQVRNIIADNPNISMMDLLTQFGADPKSFGYSIYEIITMTPGMAGEVLVGELNKDNPDIELIKNILQHSPVDVNMIVKPQIDFTALMMASYKGHTEVVKLLLERLEIDVNLQGFWGSTALMFASRYGHTEVVKGLLERPEIDVNLQNERGETALMIASYQGHTKIVKLFLKRPEIDINLQDEDGETVLMLASSYGHTEIVRMLLERPEIDVNLRDNESRTAWYQAKESIREQFPELKG